MDGPNCNVWDVLAELLHMNFNAENKLHQQVGKAQRNRHEMIGTGSQLQLLGVRGWLLHGDMTVFYVVSHIGV